MRQGISFRILRAEGARRLGLALWLLAAATFLSGCPTGSGISGRNPELRLCESTALLEKSGLEPLKRPGGPWWQPSKDRKRKSYAVYGQEGRYLIAAVSPSVRNLVLKDAGGGTVLGEGGCVYTQLKHQEKYYFEVTLGEASDRPDREIRLYQVWSPEVLQDNLDEIDAKSKKSSPWQRPNSIETLGDLADSIAKAITHARTQAGFDLGPERLAQPLVADAYKRAADGVAQSQANRPRSARQIAEISRRLAQEAASRGFDEMGDSIGCYGNRLLAEDLTATAQRLAGQPARKAAEEIDELMDRLAPGEDKLACNRTSCRDFPRSQMSEAVGRLIDQAVAYARADPCSREELHRQRLSRLSDLLESLEQRCWIEGPNPRQQTLETTIAQIQDAIDWRHNMLEDVSKISSELSYLRNQVGAALRDRATTRLTELQSQLEDVILPQMAPPKLASSCAKTEELKQQLSKLNTDRLELDSIQSWYERFQSAPWVDLGRLPSCDDITAARAFDSTRQGIVCDELNGRVGMAQSLDCPTFRSVAELFDCTRSICKSFRDRLDLKWEDCREQLELEDTESYLDAKSKEATCAACEEMERRMRELNLGAPYQRNAALRLEATFSRLLKEAGERIKDQSPASCQERDLDPRPTRTGGCCDIDVEGLIDGRRQGCCATRRTQREIKLNEQTERIDGMARLDQLSWFDFQSAVTEIEDTLSAPLGGGCELGSLSDPIAAAKSTWKGRLYGGRGVYVSLFDAMAENRGLFTNRPSSDLILNWAAARGGDKDAENWYKMLLVAKLVGQVVQRCPQSGEQPTPETLRTMRTYERLKSERQQLLKGLPRDLKQQAEIAIREAEDCVGPFDQRLLTVRFDSQCRYRERIETQNYDITERGRLIKLEFDTSKLDPEFQDVTSLIVEFFAEGYAVSARNSDGSLSTDEARKGTQEGSHVEKLESYRFRERLTDASRSEAYYLIDPIGKAVGRELHIRVVPRPY